MKETILRLLKNSDGFISGEKISKECGVSRTYIWKNINDLKAAGYVIESISRKGYRLISSPDLINKIEIKQNLKTKYIGKNIIYFDSIDSTNNHAKGIACKEEEGSVVIADQQSSGKGRLGRNWLSPSGKGIYFSIILKPKLEPNKVAKLTLISAAAVSLALRDIGIKSQIKWPNDIVINNKKLCGILTEMSCELNIINYMIIGIGINTNLDKEDICDELKEKATSLKMILNKEIDRNLLLALVLNHFESLYDLYKTELDLSKTIEICREQSALIGKEVQVIKADKIKIGKAIDISDEGELIVEFEDGIENIYSGEVSIRGLNSYI